MSNIWRYLIIFVILNGYSIASALAQEKKPNILFIAIDDLNDWTGYMNGHSQAKTPELDKLASQSTVFSNAYCSSPACGPSRTSLLYGIQTFKSGSYGHHKIYDPNNLAAFENRKTIPTCFRENGYYTAGAGKIFHYGKDNEDFEIYFKQKNARVFPDPENKESFIPKGERPYSDFQIGPVTVEDENKMHDKQYVDWAIDQLKMKHERPFFIAVGFEKPHLPWVAPQSYFDKFDLDSIRIPEILEEDLDDLPEEAKLFANSIFGFYNVQPSDHEFISNQSGLWKKMIRAYLASTSHTDAMVGKIVEALNKSLYKDNTIIVLWSDHGWHLGEKKHWRKMSLWSNGSRIPFIIKLPNSSEGSEVKVPVSLQDIYPTLVDLCNLKSNQRLDGNSLEPLLNDANSKWTHPAIVSHGPGNFAICLDDWRYISYYKGGEELYNIKNDPNEFNNLVGDSKYQSILKKLKKHVPKEFNTTLGPRFEQFYD